MKSLLDTYKTRNGYKEEKENQGILYYWWHCSIIDNSPFDIALYRT